MPKKTKDEMRMTNRTDFRPDPNYKSIDKEKEKLVLKLGTMITDRYLIKYTNTMKTTDPEFWALNAVLTKEEVKFLLSFKKTRVPYTPEEIAQRNNMSLEETQKMIDHLTWVGVLEMNRENAEKKKQYKNNDYNYDKTFDSAAEKQSEKSPGRRGGPLSATGLLRMSSAGSVGITVFFADRPVGVDRFSFPDASASGGGGLFTTA